MGDYLPIYRALIRADKNNKTCDTLSLEDNDIIIIMKIKHHMKKYTQDIVELS